MKIIPTLALMTWLIGANVNTLHWNIRENKAWVSDILEEKDPWTLYWKWKVKYETIQVWTNFFAVYDFSDYVVFEQDMADGKDKFKTKRYVIYTQKWLNGSLIFQGHYQWNTTLIKDQSWKNGIQINKTKRVESDPGIDENLKWDCARYLKKHP
jgi:hypothetical protein